MERGGAQAWKHLLVASLAALSLWLWFGATTDARAAAGPHACGTPGPTYESLHEEERNALPAYNLTGTWLMGIETKGGLREPASEWVRVSEMSMASASFTGEKFVPEGQGGMTDGIRGTEHGTTTAIELEGWQWSVDFSDVCTLGNGRLGAVGEASPNGEKYWLEIIPPPAPPTPSPPSDTQPIPVQPSAAAPPASSPSPAVVNSLRAIRPMGLRLNVTCAATSSTCPLSARLSTRLGRWTVVIANAHEALRRGSAQLALIVPRRLRPMLRRHPRLSIELDVTMDGQQILRRSIAARDL